jgi:regulator of sigma E protease
MDTDQMKQEPQPWEFRAKPAWQRLIVMLGGIFVNVVVGILIFIGIAFFNGKEYLSREEVNKYGIVAGELGQAIGLKTGDKITEVNGKSYHDFTEVMGSDVFLGTNSYYTVDRNGEKLQIDIPNNYIDKLSEPGARENFIRVFQPFHVKELVPGSAADKAGIKVGDKLTAVNGAPVADFGDFRMKIDSLKGKTVQVTAVADGQTRELEVTVSEEGTIGFYPEILLNFTKIDYSLGESISIGTANAFNVVYTNIQGFGKIFSGDVSPSKALSGPIGIARMFGGVWDWSRFWYLTGLLSMVLAFMNALPIPALDGGHSVILLYEMISGRKPSDVFLENAQKVGMVLLLGLMAFAVLNDVWKVFF